MSRDAAAWHAAELLGSSVLKSWFGLEKNSSFFPWFKKCFIEVAKQAQRRLQTPAFKTVLHRVFQTDDGSFSEH